VITLYEIAHSFEMLMICTQMSINNHNCATYNGNAHIHELCVVRGVMNVESLLN
jgi:hypothetical protein